MSLCFLVNLFWLRRHSHAKYMRAPTIRTSQFRWPRSTDQMMMFYVKRLYSFSNLKTPAPPFRNGMRKIWRRRLGLSQSGLRKQLISYNLGPANPCYVDRPIGSLITKRSGSSVTPLRLTVPSPVERIKRTQNSTPLLHLTPNFT
jgi:hypothetical protein